MPTHRPHTPNGLLPRIQSRRACSSARERSGWVGPPLGAGNRRRSRSSASLVAFACLMALITGCFDKPGESVSNSATTPQASSSPAGAGHVLAILDGRIVTLDEFLAFLTEARGPGYRPATRAEAMRLVRAHLRTLLVEGPAAASDPRASERATAAGSAVAARARAIGISDAELERFADGHPYLRGGEDPARRDALRDQLRRHRVERQSRLAIDALLDETPYRVETSVVEGLVQPQSGGPPLPPGHRAGAHGLPEVESQ